MPYSLDPAQLQELIFSTSLALGLDTDEYTTFGDIPPAELEALIDRLRGEILDINTADPNSTANSYSDPEYAAESSRSLFALWDSSDSDPDTTI